MLSDITRCHGIGCSIRGQCLRHVAPVPDNVARANLLAIAAELEAHQ